MTETATRKIEIVIDHLPAAELNPNNLRRSHWSVRSEATRVAKDEIGWQVKAAIIMAEEKGLEWGDKPIQRARISYEFHFKDNRNRDWDGLIGACKAWQDGLIEAGVICYDDIKHLTPGKMEYFYDGEEKTVITVEEVALMPTTNRTGHDTALIIPNTKNPITRKTKRLVKAQI